MSMGSQSALWAGDAATPAPENDSGLPANFAEWFGARGWSPHPHQFAMLEAARRDHHTLLIAPTGGGKTLPGSCRA